MPRWTGVLAGLLVIASCVQPPEYPLEPIIVFESISSTSLNEIGEDTVYLSLTFTDGDGNLGSGNAEDPDADTVKNVIVEDTRQPGFPILYHIDEVVPRSNVQAISGRIDLRFDPGFFICFGSEEADTLRMTVRVIDRAGNESNTIQTPMLRLNCN